jgi:hypothetical protein
MRLLPGLRLVVAPHFHASSDWSQRLSLGAGVEPTAEGLFPRPPWRPAHEDELAMLVLDPAGPTARQELPGCLCLFVVPGHLRSAFWDLLAQAQERGEISPDGFSAFVAEIGRFLAFKQLPAPAGAVFDLVVNHPAQPQSLAPASLWGLINLGEEAASVVFLNIRQSEIPGSDYPPVRFDLASGEGVRLPVGVVLGSEHSGAEQPEVLLLIRPPEEGSPL